MKNKNSKVIRTDIEFNKFIQDIQTRRVILKKDSITKPLSSQQITKAMTKHKLMPMIKEDIIMEWNKKWIKKDLKVFIWFLYFLVLS